VTATEGLHVELEELLVCPVDRGPLIWRHGDGVVYNPRLGLAYPIRDGIAQLLDTESFAVDASGRATHDGRTG
jgi:uncharacterized protein YbaR (Trm112 family)